MQVEPLKTETKMGAGSKLWKAMLASGAGLAALAALNSTVPRRHLELPSGDVVDAENGEAQFYEWTYGEVFYRVAGNANNPPLVFVHDIAPGVSSFMWWRNFGRLSANFRVYALDLLGFGASAKPPVAPYSTDFYVTQIADFLRDVVGEKATLVGSGLGAVFAARVAIEHTDSTESLILIAPPGLSDERDARAGMRGAAFYSLLNSPVLGTSFYNTLASERALRDYTRRQLFFNKRLATKGLVAHLYAQSHQHGAQHAVTAYLSGYVAANIRTPLAAVTVPTIIMLDDSSHDSIQPETLRALNPNLTVEIFDNSRLWLHAEHPDRFNALIAR
ncbi:MAG: alpha/beta hydrolase [Pyrinomonadaceae bacterium MAG19_C2-C3]|nr:alpha/beta hydrolase [Pyrinomonadaceae bacterium MAG19_C2-C3]